MQILNILIYLLTLGCLKVRIVERELLPCLPFQKKKKVSVQHIVVCLKSVRSLYLLAALGLCCHAQIFVAVPGLSLVAASMGCSLLVVSRLPVQVASLVVEHRLYGAQAQ